MAFTSKLAELFIEFVTKGVSEFTTALDGVHDKLERIKTGMDQVAKVAAYGFATATASLMGFVRAGTQGTAIGAQFAFQMGVLSRNIAGLFQPEMQKAIDLIRSAVDWLRSLTDQQRANIVRWVEAAAAAALVAIALPRVVAGIILTVNALRALAVAITAGLSATGIGALLPLVGAIISIVSALVVGTEAGRGALGKFLGILSEFAAVVGRLLGPIFSAIGTVVGKITDAFEQVAGPVMAAIDSIAEALQPLFNVVGEIAKAFGDILAGAIRVLAVVVIDILTALRPFISFLAQLASVVLSAVVPVFKAFGAILSGIAKTLAYITGVKINWDTPKHKAPDASGNRRETAQNLGGFENLDAIYNRIAQASVQVGKPVAERQYDVAVASDTKLEQIKGILAGQKPAFSGAKG
jgi:phage-related protein